MPSFIRHLGLVSQSNQVPMSDLTKVAAALQKQATRDLAPAWGISATVDAFVQLSDVPTDYWPMIIKDNINRPGAIGIHEDDAGQPYALITASANIDRWSLTASHEMLEILVDPFGSRVQAGDAPQLDGQAPQRVNYLVEVADPSEAARFGYSINGVLVCDFYTPHYFDPVPGPVRYSYTGAITRPRQVLEGGYLSWQNLTTGEWWQEYWPYGAPQSAYRNLGILAGKGSIRAQIDSVTEERLETRGDDRKSAMMAGLDLGELDRSTAARAERLQARIDAQIA